MFCCFSVAIYLDQVAIWEGKVFMYKIKSVLMLQYNKRNLKPLWGLPRK